MQICYFYRFKPHYWSNICSYFNSSNQSAMYINNGEEFKIPIIIPKDQQVSLDRKHLEKAIIGTNAIRTRQYSGEIADLNIWGKQLDSTEIHDWMNCNSSMKGDIFNDKDQGYKTYDISGVNGTLMDCKKSSPGLVHIPKR